MRRLILGLALAALVGAPKPGLSQSLQSPSTFCFNHPDVCLGAALGYLVLSKMMPAILGNNCAFGFSATNSYEFAGHAYAPNGQSIQEGISGFTCSECGTQAAVSNQITQGTDPGRCVPSSYTFNFASQFCGLAFSIPLGVCANERYGCTTGLASCCPLNPPTGSCF